MKLVRRRGVRAGAGLMLLVACGSGTDGQDVASSEAAATPSPSPVAAYSSLTCAANDAVLDSSVELDPDAFDKIGAVSPVEAARNQAGYARTSKSASARQLGEATRFDVDQSALSADVSEVDVEGRRPDGSMVALVHVQRGGKTKKWLATGSATCDKGGGDLRNLRSGAPNPTVPSSED